MFQKTKYLCIIFKTCRQLLELCPQIPTGALPLDPAGGLPFPRPTNLPTPRKNPAGAHT